MSTPQLPPRCTTYSWVLVLPSPFVLAPHPRTQVHKKQLADLVEFFNIDGQEGLQHNEFEAMVQQLVPDTTTGQVRDQQRWLARGGSVPLLLSALF